MIHHHPYRASYMFRGAIAVLAILQGLTLVVVWQILRRILPLQQRRLRRVVFLWGSKS